MQLMPEADNEGASGHKGDSSPMVQRKAASEKEDGQQASEDDDAAAQHLVHGCVSHREPRVEEARCQQIASGWQRK